MSSASYRLLQRLDATCKRRDLCINYCDIPDSVQVKQCVSPTLYYEQQQVKVSYTMLTLLSCQWDVKCPQMML